MKTSLSYSLVIQEVLLGFSVLLAFAFLIWSRRN